MLQSPLFNFGFQLSRCVNRCLVAIATCSRQLSSSSAPAGPSQSQVASSKTPRIKRDRFIYPFGDQNQVTLVGTVTKVTPKQTPTGKPYTLLKLATLFRYKDVRSGLIRSRNCYHQVSTFSPNLMKIVSKVQPGDRLFVCAQVEYFFAGQPAKQVPILNPSRIFPMLPKAYHPANEPLEADSDEYQNMYEQLDAEHFAGEFD